MHPRQRLQFDGHAGALLIEWQRQYRLNDQPVANAFGAALSPHLADLLDIAMAVYVSDRTCLRKPHHVLDPFGLVWGRRMSLRIGVRDPDFWHRDSRLEALLDLLRWLTEDEWDIEFVEHVGALRGSELQTHLFASPPSSDTAVALFSGGLDSLAGLSRDLQDRRPLVLVSGATTSRIASAQASLLSAVATRLERALPSVIVPFSLIAAPNPQERSQRSRGFMFLVLGFATAITAGLQQLRVYENGVGAINLPYLESQVGTHSTRAMHPLTLEKAEHLFRLVAESDFTVQNPSFLLTKAELCRLLPEPLIPLIPRAVSCDGFPQRVPGTPACGRCTSCLLRRQSLWAAGLAEVDQAEPRRHDVLVRSDKQAAFTLGAMLRQAAAIELALSAGEPWDALLEQFPPLAHLAHFDDRQAVLKLLGRYAAEWRGFPAAAVARYFGSAGSLDSRGAARARGIE